MKTCFVISPIGDPGSDVLEHADDVFDFIVRPTAEKAGYLPIRADHEERPGTITEHMYDHILGDDLLIAILTGHNLTMAVSKRHSIEASSSLWRIERTRRCRFGRACDRLEAAKDFGA